MCSNPSSIDARLVKDGLSVHVDGVVSFHNPSSVVGINARDTSVLSFMLVLLISVLCLR